MARGRAANYEDQREMILARAAELFANRGYPATSMNQVAEAAGLSKATLYHYYRDKYSLLVEIAEGHVARLVAMVEDVQAQPLEPEARVRELVARIMREYAHAQHAHRVLTDDVRFLDPKDCERIRAMQRRVTAGFAAALAQWHPEQDVAGLVKPLTMLLFGMINWMFTWLRPEGELTHETMGSIVADLLVGGVPAVRAPDVTTISYKSTKTAPRRRPARAEATSTEGDNT
ncbi:TetR/AcrR family transcriptional regulator [Azohydromonas caseinilytica]|uniref:TetR/AcrR family transcriptional regulator n=1 Tax=Azohydromonas caseinilytica TaxID=2728836 RepID=A0A848F945_9BURK|nr:TetR/AcrR family transcriptional regulator [Azohydromonas caseinilytica]NML16657.1 TetR/AcrR family transcriptional regulator [Azohydromonas caseinilytica]